MDSDLDNDPPELGRLRDPRGLWRFVGWGSLAAMALTGAVLVTQTDVGAQRLQTAFEPLTSTLTGTTAARIDIPPQAAAAKDITKETEVLRLETTRLRAEVRQLAADRDRLNARIAGLESSLSDITGSVKRELSLLAATAPAAPPPVIARPDSAPPRSDAAATGGDEARPADAGRKQDKSQARFESRADIGPEAERKTETKPEAKAEHRPETPARWTNVESVPLPPVRIASVPPAAQPGKSDIGIELGGARSMDVLHARWLAVKANFGPYIDGMHPLVLHDQRPGINIPFRLIVGPVPNGAAAAQLCQRFAASKVTCRTTRFAGEPLQQP